SEKLPLKIGEHFINKGEGATASAHSITPDRCRICFDAELKSYGSVSESGEHVQPAGGGL
ncbi:MAG: hypothetical protein WAO76_18395, partial [Georgfuchsia sp.]